MAPAALAGKSGAPSLLLCFFALCACEARTTSVGSYNLPVTMGRGVDVSEITVQAVTTFGPVPVFAALTGYGGDEASAASATQVPTYAPFDSTDPAWWDELVAEQSQARVRRVLFPTRGALALDTADLSGPGNMNPRRLSAWVDAVARADSGGLFEAGCFVDTPFLAQLASAFHAAPSATPFDLASKSDWNDIVWLRAIKPWFDTVPSTLWWTLNDDTPGGRGPAVIQFGALDSALFINAPGNLSQLLSFVATQFEASYGSAAVFVLDGTWFAADTSVPRLASVVGNSPNFSPPSTPNAFTAGSNGNKTFGTAVAGFSDPSYDDPASPNYQSASVVIPRKTNDGSGVSRLTLEAGLSAAAAANAVTLVQGFTDYATSAGLYRSPAWDFPNQYLNLIRRYSDLRTVTLRLEAEGCDRFNDSTPGNSGGAFLRTGDLDVRPLGSSSGWAVTDTAPGEWLEFQDVDFSSGNYEFIASYATTDGATASEPPSKRLQIAIDGNKLLPTVLPGSARAEAFSASFLGRATLSPGPHTVRLTFLDGQIDLDWLFLKKTDFLATLGTSTGTFVSAIGGGNDVLEGRIAKASIYEHFSLDDLNGGSLSDGDRVNLQCYDGYYLTADTTSGTLSASARAPGAGAEFIIKSLSGPGVIADGQSIALQTTEGGRYVTVGSDTAETMSVSGTSVAAEQTFALGLAPQSPQ